MSTLSSLDCGRCEPLKALVKSSDCYSPQMNLHAADHSDFADPFLNEHTKLLAFVQCRQRQSLGKTMAATRYEGQQERMK